MATATDQTDEPGLFSPGVVRKHREMDKIYETFRQERLEERIVLRHRKTDVADTIPFRIAEGYQLWVPVEISAVLRSLWEPVLQVLPPTEQASSIRLWWHFLHSVFNAPTSSSTIGANNNQELLTPTGRRLLLRLALSQFDEVISQSTAEQGQGASAGALPPLSLSSAPSSSSFTSSQLPSNDVHCATVSEPNQAEILRLYYEVKNELALHPSGILSSPALSPASLPFSALLSKARSGQLGLFAIWGGQGPQWLAELRNLYWTYPQSRGLIEKASLLLNNLCKSHKQFFARNSIDLLGFIYFKNSTTTTPSTSTGSSYNNNTQPQSSLLSASTFSSSASSLPSFYRPVEELPSAQFLASAPVSYPAIGLTQMIHWYLATLLLNVTPSDFLAHLKGASGHSQGLMAAVVAAVSASTHTLEQNILRAVELLFYIGNRIQQVSLVPATASPELEQQSQENGWGAPSPMLTIFHLEPQVLQKYVNVVNRMMSLNQRDDSSSLPLEVSLINGQRALVITGHPDSLHSLLELLHRAEIPRREKLDQSRVPFSKRKKEFSFAYLRVSAPFHHSSLKTALPLIQQDAESMSVPVGSPECPFRASALQIPVYSSTGQDLRKVGSANDGELMRTVIAQIVSEKVNWPLALQSVNRANGVTHLLDFGPGELSGIGTICERNFDGAGISVIAVGSFRDSPYNSLRGKAALLDARSSAVPRAVCWAEDFAPRLMKRERDNQICVDTRMSRLLNRPPLMVAGMTPTTVSSRLVSAALNAGFHAELAGGGLPTEQMFRTKIQEILDATSPGTGVSVNMLFLNPRLWGMQFPLLMRLALDEGITIEGVTIAAGVPSIDNANELLRQCREAGIRHVSFKPGTEAMILEVLEIAKANANSNIIIQWTGGRGGGHHSFEDFHEPVLATYSQIRRCNNVVLVAGSGFGDAEGSYPYLTGEWSLRFGRPAMPFDGILLGSRVMVAAEAETAAEAKELIVQTAGITDDSLWERSFNGEAGGVMTVRSELGQPIHKIATRGLRVWADFDRDFFSLTNKDKRLAQILDRKAHIIERLNADYQKVYFGQHLNGRVADISAMTYEEVLVRLIELTYVKQSAQGPRWIHADFAKRAYEFALRVEERFTAAKEPYPATDARVPPFNELLQGAPAKWLESVLGEFAQARKSIVCQEDIDFFLQLCRRRGLKPVNFVPIIDADLEFWFKRDSLWASEDLEAVQDRDVGRVVILQGPMSCAYSLRANEPVADILNGIQEGWIAKLVSERSLSIPVVKDFRTNLHGHSVNDAEVLEVLPHLAIERTATVVRVSTDTFSAPLESGAAELWSNWLAQPGSSWWRAFLNATYVFQGKRRVKNDYLALFALRPNTSYRLTFASNNSQEDAAASTTASTIERIEVLTEDGTLLDVVVAPGSAVNSFSVTLLLLHSAAPTDRQKQQLVFEFLFHPEDSSIHEITNERNQMIKQFYASLWFASPPDSDSDPFTAEFVATATVTAESVKAFAQAIQWRAAGDLAELGAPVDYAIVLCWEALTRPLFLRQIDGDLLQLVHLSNSFKMLAQPADDRTPVFRVGMQITSRMILREIATVAAGERITVGGCLSCEGVDLVEIESQFLFRTNVPFSSPHFSRSQSSWSLDVSSREVLAILKSKKWVHFNTELSDSIIAAQPLHLHLNVFEEELRRQDRARRLANIRVTGTITMKDREVGEVRYLGEEVEANPVIAFLKRFGHPLVKSHVFSSGGYKMLNQPSTGQAPSDNHAYAAVSGDYNPIHTEWGFAALARLPSTIAHGMWTSANANRVVELVAGRGFTSRIVEYQCQFVGMVQSREELRTQVRHVGMKNGDLLVEVDSRIVAGESETTVLKGSALVRAPNTALVFTGQGSAEVGMGMELYRSSRAAKDVWDEGEQFLLDSYGISILHIVQQNPKALTIHFGGRRGAAIRSNFQRLTTTVRDGGVKRQVPLFPDITDLSASYTFRHHEGLLYATQFSQPALVLMEFASLRDMQERGLVSSRSIFTGHSLGEYAALSAVAGVLRISSLVEITFLRGMTMQNAVIRDANGRSNFGMVAANPQRVHSSFKEKELQQVIDLITSLADGRLLQIVNFNVIYTQYVVAGELSLLRALDFALTALSLSPAKPVPQEALAAITARSFQEAEKLGAAPLVRGHATIPLPGIDVPFHSRFLSAGVPAFREVLQARILPNSIDPAKLIGRYIPNVVAEPFDVSRAYVQLVQTATNSEVLRGLLTKMDTAPVPATEIAYDLILELLAYQFASPVLWIQTQHHFFTSLNVERLVEVGPAPTLCNMARRTLESGLYSTLVQREFLWIGRDRKRVYYEIDDVAEAPAAAATASSSSASSSAASPVAATQPAPSVPVAVAAPVISSLPSSQGQAVPDQPPSALLSLRVILASKLKKSLAAIAPTTTIKDLVGGKSALQNEIVGDLAKEFGSEPDGAAEMDLETLAEHLGRKYLKIGPLLAGLTSRIINAKSSSGWPASTIRSFLQSEYGLGELRTDAALAHAILAEPAQRLSSDESVRSWLAAIVKEYGESVGLNLQPASATAGGAVGGAVAAIDPKALNDYKGQVQSMVRRQLDALLGFLDQDSDLGQRVLLAEQQLRKDTEEKLAVWLREHGPEYQDGMAAIFNAQKARRFKSSWNWVRQDSLALYFDYSMGRATRWSSKIRERLYHIKNRATPESVQIVSYYAKKASLDGYPEILSFITLLGETLKAAIHDPPLYREFGEITAPSLKIDCKGRVLYEEVNRPGVKTMEAYVAEMRRGVATQRILESASRALGLTSEDEPSSSNVQQQIAGKLAALRAALPADQAAALELLSQLEQTVASSVSTTETETVPYLFLRRPTRTDPTLKAIDAQGSERFFEVLSGMAKSGVSFEGKTVLLTGCGRDSIGAELLKGLLRGGALVYATTSRPTNTSAYFQAIYDNHGAKGSALVVVPFNGGSVQDIQSLVRFLYESEKVDVDIVIPFAATSENGVDIAAIDGKSELAHRIMMTNVVRLVGAIMEQKRSLRIETRPAHVLLPLSPNHGCFGFDGLYAESKLGLEALLDLWESEGWRGYLSLAGAIIGWTRGTGLMNQNNIVAAGVEELGARTFSVSEMSFNLMGLLHPAMIDVAQSGPVLCDLNGGLHVVKRLNEIVAKIRADIALQSSTSRAVSRDRFIDTEVEKGKAESIGKRILPRATVSGQTFPELPTQKSSSIARLRGMFDLSSVVVVTGFGEVGPWGSARTRWEMEASGEFSIEGCLELAWLMGFIKYRNVASDDQEPGWIDARTGTPVRDHEVKARYEEEILKHCGVRIVEPSILGFEPDNKTLLHQVAIEHDLPPIEVTTEEAERFRQKHGDKVSIAVDEETGVTRMKVLRGATIFVPKSLRSDRFVAGQIPSTWDPAIYGIPEDIINQVDRSSLFTLVSTAEALVSAGVTDFYEFYQYVHLAEVGNTIGSGMGGMHALKDIHVKRLLDEPVQGDALQETFINTTAAWVNMLLVSSAGPILTPVGACATAVKSIDIGVQLIKSGKARVCLVGGFDDIGEESINEFGSMRATADSIAEQAAGRAPSEMSRPATSTRAGFVEAHGAGVEILTSAELALKMGLPVYGIIAHVATATDKEGRSVPAPGQGILTTARQSFSRVQSPLLDLDYRRAQLERDLASIEAWAADEVKSLPERIAQQRKYMKAQQADEEDENDSNSSQSSSSTAELDDAEIASELAQQLEISKERRKSDARRFWSEGCFRQHPNIAPLKAALASWGLTVDDLGVASFHGTSTKANDKNESEVLQKQLEHLGRSKGNLILTIFQKWLTGHPKGAAASWMLHGVMQSMLTGLLPGNRNADDIDEQLRKYDLVMYSSHSLQTYGFKAGLLKSFGFGQVGSEVLVVHPDFLLGQLSDDELQHYARKRTNRGRQAFRHWQLAITGNRPFVPIKSQPPFLPEEETQCYLDPLCRARFDPRLQSWRIRLQSSKEGIADVLTPTPQRSVEDQFDSPRASEPASASSSSSSSTTASSSSSSSSSSGNLRTGGGLRRNVSYSALTQLEVTLREMGEGLRTKVDRGIGVDAQSIPEIEISLVNSEWVARNFTAAEIHYCRFVSSDPSASFAGRFAAKEAVIKAISNSDMNATTRNLWRGSGAPLVDIEIAPSASGAPHVVLSGHAAELANLLGITTIRVAISHSGEYAVAQAHVQ